MAKSYWLIGGSREFEDKKVFGEVMADNLLAPSLTYELVIVSGGCRGVDTMAREYALSKGLQLKEFKPDWKKYGRAAGPKRNDEMTAYMAEHGRGWSEGHALFFWDGESRGTKQCIESARKAGIPVRIWNTKTGNYMEDGEQG